MIVNTSNNLDILAPEHPHRRIHILLSILAVAIVAASFTFYKLRVGEDLAQVVTDNDPELQREKLIEVSESLTIQPQTPQFKAKLEEVSRSLNKK